ncbi:MAG TPA: glycosyltransferase [Solirubrobacteraceae bacterium]|nr:glycosyltransferase [Solirubrobacteraceae bacterium]
MRRFGYLEPLAPVPAWIAPEVRAAAGAPPERDAWPLISIVVPTRDGRSLLERLVAGLAEATDYPALELVVVDDGSADGSVSWLGEAVLPFPVTLLPQGRNRSFAAACNRGAAAARGNLVLFLNNDVEPVEDGWLKRLVAGLEEARAGAAGAILVDPATTSDRGRAGAVQHRDLVLWPRDDALRIDLRGRGGDLAGALGPDRRVGAVAAACVLVRHTDFDGVGGFSELFEYGLEDADLCFKLAAAGRPVLASGTAVLGHRAVSTRRAAPDVAGRAVQDANRRLLLERWGPRLRREYALDVAAGTGVWRDPVVAPAPFSAEITYRVLTDDPDLEAHARRLAKHLRKHGRPATAGEGGWAWLLDDVVVRVDRGPARHPVLRGRTCVLLRLEGPPPPELEAGRYDLVLAGRRSAEDLAARVDGVIATSGGPPRILPAATAAAAVSRAPARRRAIVVLGMSRTGTSATTRLLNLCGLGLGPEDRHLAPIESINDKGFYEHYALMRLNTALLRRFGGNWRNPPDLPDGWEQDPSLDDLRDQARRLLAEDFGAAELWGFKDPRTCLTLPFWRPLIGEADYVICHRHPLDVAASLERRDGLTTAQSLSLWERYVAEALAHSSGARRLIVGYEEYFAHRDAVIAALAAFVSGPGLGRDDDLRARADEWLSAELRHHVHAPADLVAEPAASHRIVAMHALLELAVRVRGEEPVLAGAGGSGPVSDALDALARDVLHGLREEQAGSAEEARSPS